VIRGQGVRSVPLSAPAFEHGHGRLRLALGGRGHTQVGAQPVAAIHQRVRAKAQARFLARPLAHEPGVAIGGALAGVVASLLSVKVAVRRLVLISFGPKALRASPGFNERAVHREVFVVEQPRRSRQGRRLGKKLRATSRSNSRPRFLLNVLASKPGSSTSMPKNQRKSKSHSSRSQKRRSLRTL
jgi:hypothetical protein